MLQFIRESAKLKLQLVMLTLKYTVVLGMLCAPVMFIMVACDEQIPTKQRPCPQGYMYIRNEQGELVCVPVQRI